MIEPKAFFRTIETLSDAVPGSLSARELAGRLIPLLLERLGDELGLLAAALYERYAGQLKLRTAWGAPIADPAPEIVARLAPDGDQELPWAGETAAGTVGLIALGDDARWLVALAFAPARDGGAPTASQALALLSPLQYALAQRLRRGALEDMLEQARAIQLSLLPPSRPVFGDFDIAALSIPAERVGGDLYDFISLDEDTLAIAIADASGHGLPAALQARDVATGLRMGVERDLKIARTVEKLNRVIHRSGLVTRFVSMVFGELELNGNLSYINAGHPPPLLLNDGGFHELAVGGLLLGPHPETAYKTGFAHIDRGAQMLLYTDGVVECGIGRARAFGTDGLRTWMLDWREGPADRALDDLLARLRSVAGSAPFEDDLTAMFVRRPRA